MSVEQSTRSIPILMYHSISQPTNFVHAGYRDSCVPPMSFEAQIDYLYRNMYTILNVSQLIQILNDKSPIPDKTIVLTFDDGYADFYYSALPILSRYNLTATLYVVTGCVGKTALWLRRERQTGQPMLTWKQIAEISNSGIECGAHTHSHPKLDTLSLTMAKEEIRCSKDLLEQHLGQQVTSFAYPYGYYTSDMRRLVKEAGFTSACVVKYAMCSEKTDCFTLERLAITPNMDMRAFHACFTQEGYSQLRKMYVRARIPVKHALRCGVAWVSRLYNKGAR
jgi:peptidoglycan/xylan/chitin deacetylase (PgdA/CDA1 family)